jgi:CRP-like cAMP-binding protein
MEDLPPDYVFGTLPEHTLPEQLDNPEADSLSRVTVPAGTTILRQGASGGKFFIIATGEVEVVRTRHGADRVVTRLGPGQFFGEIAILRDIAHTATVRAITDVSLLTMERDKFRSLVEHSLGMTRDFDTIIQARLSALLDDEDLELLSRGPFYLGLSALLDDTG